MRDALLDFADALSIAQDFAADGTSLDDLRLAFSEGLCASGQALAQSASEIDDAARALGSEADELFVTLNEVATYLETAGVDLQASDYSSARDSLEAAQPGLELFLGHLANFYTAPEVEVGIDAFLTDYADLTDGLHLLSAEGPDPAPLFQNLAQVMIDGPVAAQQAVIDVYATGNVFLIQVAEIDTVEDLLVFQDLPATMQDPQFITLIVNGLTNPSGFLQELVALAGLDEFVSMEQHLRDAAENLLDPGSPMPPACHDQCSVEDDPCNECTLCESGIGTAQWAPGEWKKVMKKLRRIVDPMKRNLQTPYEGLLVPIRIIGSGVVDKLDALKKVINITRPHPYIKVCIDICTEVRCDGWLLFPWTWEYELVCKEKRSEWHRVPVPTDLPGNAFDQLGDWGPLSGWSGLEDDLTEAVDHFIDQAGCENLLGCPEEE